jgi:hypothetical protein
MGIAEFFKCPGANVLQHKTAGNSTTFVGYLPTKGIRSVSLLCIAEMGNSTDMTITVKTADDSSGTNPTVLTQNVAVYKDGVKLTAAQAFTETAATGKTVYLIEIPASIIPADKYVGVYADSGSASNGYTVIAIEDTYYKG